MDESQQLRQIYLVFITFLHSLLYPLRDFVGRRFIDNTGLQ